MGRRGRPRADQEIEVPEIDQLEEIPTFATAKGTEANQQAKKLAKEKSKKKATAAHTFYTLKGLKVIKLIVKADKVFSVYIGNISTKKHKAALEPMIKGWKAEGVWLEPHQVEEKTKEIMKQLA